MVSTLKKLLPDGAASGCCAMEIKTRLRALLMLLWIFQGKLINLGHWTAIKPRAAVSGSEGNSSPVCLNDGK